MLELKDHCLGALRQVELNQEGSKPRKSIEKLKDVKYNFTSLNDLNLEGSANLRNGSIRATTQNKISLAGRTSQGFYPEGSKEEEDKFKEYSTGYNSMWKARGESVGESKADKKFTFRIKKEQQFSTKDKTGYSSREIVPGEGQGNHKLALEGVYVGYRDKTGGEQGREKRPFKEMSVNEKINKQMVVQKGGPALRLNTLYMGEKSSKDEIDQNDIKQNNFMRTNGFTNGRHFNHQEGGNAMNFRDTRKYEKPWLKNTVHELATTQMVPFIYERTGGEQVLAS